MKSELKEKYVIFALADIHSRKISINDFINKGFDINNKRHIIVLLGDYFDRYYDSKNVLEFCEYLIEALNDRVYFIYGNHDLYAKRFIDSIIDNNGFIYDKAAYFNWRDNGGRNTILDLIGDIESDNFKYNNIIKNNILRLSNFLNKLIPYFESDNYIFTHNYIDSNYKVDTVSRKYLNEEVLFDKYVVVGHTTFNYLLRRNEFILIKDKGDIVINEKLTNSAIYIDNGQGNNIVVFSDYISKS